MGAGRLSDGGAGSAMTRPSPTTSEDQNAVSMDDSIDPNTASTDDSVDPAGSDSSSDEPESTESTDGTVAEPRVEGPNGSWILGTTEDEAWIEVVTDFPTLPDGAEPGSAVLAFLPHGKEFPQPVRVFVPSDVDPERGIPATASPGGSWTRAEGAVPTENGFEVDVDHFSFFAVFICSESALTVLGIDCATLAVLEQSPAGDEADDAPVGGDLRPRPLKVVGAAEEGHWCLLTVEGGVYCWGDNAYGQLGLGDTSSRDEPTLVPGIDDAVDIDTFAGTTCVVHADGGVSCWGQGAWRGEPTYVFGEDRANQLVPVRSDVVQDAVAITTNGAQACAIRSEGSVLCWGGFETGARPLEGMASALAIDSGYGGTCVATTDSIRCGIAITGPLGALGGDLEPGVGNFRIEGLDQFEIQERVTAISVDRAGVCGSRVDGGLVCWNTLGLTEPTILNQDVMFGHVHVEPNGHGCGIDEGEGVLWCFTSNTFEQYWCDESAQFPTSGSTLERHCYPSIVDLPEFEADPPVSMAPGWVAVTQSGRLLGLNIFEQTASPIPY
jgi:hypothetical protein